MNNNENREKQEFIHIMLNAGFHPAISTHSLIDNIFTKSMIDYIYSGLLINDLNDYLPIFIVSERNMDHNNSDYQPMHIRNINENTLKKS